MLWTFRHLDVPATEKVQQKWGVGDVESASAAAEQTSRPKKGTKKFDPIAYIMEFACGWELKEEFNAKNVNIFFANYPTAWTEVLKVYWAERMGARAKN